VSDLVRMARAAAKDDRLSDGDLYAKLADELERARAVRKDLVSNEGRKRDIIRRINYLTSCDAERMSDYKRINALIIAARDAVVLLERIEDADD